MDKFKALTTHTQEEFAKLLTEFNPLMTEKVRNYTLKGENRKVQRSKECKLSSLYGNSSKLIFIILTYLKEHPNQHFMGDYIGISQAKVSEWIKYILPVLIQTLQKIDVLPCRGNYFEIPEKLDNILCDVTERIINRSVDYEVQKDHFSGKKKAHTVKNLAFTDKTGYVYYLSETYQGSVHDKTIWDNMTLKKSDINVIVDLGFLGADKDYENVIIPFKASKNKEITPLQQKINKGIASVRIKVEHAFSGVKRLRIVSQKINLRMDEIKDKVMLIATALHNFRTINRNMHYKP
jgi:hypothetical protein